MKFQRGFSLNALMIGGAVLFGIAVLAMKVAPEYMEYNSVTKAVKATATDGSLKDATVAQVRAAYSRRAEIDNVTSMPAQDLDITKEGGELVISFAYTRKVPLFHNVSLVFDFQGASNK